MARKSKYNKEMVERICGFIRDGDTQRLTCKKVGIAEDTFCEWMKHKDGFSEAVKKAKEDFRATIVGKLEATLWKRAMGYEVTEIDTEYVSDANGNPRIKSQKTKVKHIQPDTGALIFALTNVAPERWVNKQKVEPQDVKADNNDTHGYCFEDLPQDVLFDIADKLQEAEFDRVKREKDGKASD